MPHSGQVLMELTGYIRRPPMLREVEGVGIGDDLLDRTMLASIYLGDRICCINLNVPRTFWFFRGLTRVGQDKRSRSQEAPPNRGARRSCEKQRTVVPV